METNKLYNAKWEDILPTIPDESIDLVFTDPPYNVASSLRFYDYRSRTGLIGDEMREINFNFGEWDYGFNPVPFLLEVRRVLQPSGSIVVWTSDVLLPAYYTYFKTLLRLDGSTETNFYVKCPLVWIKANPLCNKFHVNYRMATEFMIWASKYPIKKNCENFNFISQEDMKNVFYAPIVGGKERCGHPCQKPLSVCQEIIRRHCRPDGIVLDFFSGVATISLAAYSLGRRYIGIEMDEKYHKKGLRRIKDYKIKVEEKTDDFEQIKMF